MAKHSHINGVNKRGGRFYGGTPGQHGCILLYGPPGCGKTHFLKSTSNEFKLATEMISCKRLKEDFIEGVKTQIYFTKLFARARESAPSMIILDEIDEITSKGSLKDLKIRKSVYQLLRELDHMRPGDRILITATSDRPFLIEPLLFKARRFDKLIFVPMPNLESRIALFELFLKDYDPEEDINTKSLGRITRGFNGLDIKKVVGYANELSQYENRKLNMHYLESAVKAVGPSLTARTLEPIKKFFMRYKTGALWHPEQPARGRPAIDTERYKRRRARPLREEVEFEITDDSEEVEFEIDDRDVEEGEEGDEDEFEIVSWSDDEDNDETKKDTKESDDEVLSWDESVDEESDDESAEDWD